MGLKTHATRWRSLWFPGLGPFVDGPLALLLLLLWLGGTQAGLRALAGLATELAPDLIRIGRIEGRLLDRVAVTDLAIRLPVARIDVGRLDLAWSPARLVGGVLAIREVRLSDVELLLEGTGGNPPGLPLFGEPVLPWRVEVALARIDSLRIRSSGQVAPLAVLESAELSAHLGRSALTLDAFALTAVEPAFDLSGRGVAHLTDPPSLDLTLNWNGRPVDTVALSGTTRIAGDPTRLAIDSRVMGAADLDLRLEIQDPFDRRDWSARLDLFGLDLLAFVPAWRPPFPSVVIHGTLAASGGADRATLIGRVDVESPDLPALGRPTVSLDLLLREHSLAVHALEVTRAGTETRLSTTGRIDLAPSGTPDAGPDRFDLRTDWRHLRWPLQDGPIAASEQGGLRVSGDLDRLGLELEARDVGLAGVALAALSATAELAPTSDGRFRLDIAGRDLGAVGRRWESFSLGGEGRASDHRVGLTLVGGPLAVDLGLSGGLADDGAYRGRLTRLRLDGTDLGTWALQAPAPIDLDGPAIGVGPLCLDERRGSGGCLDLARADPESWTLGISLDRLDLALLGPLLPMSPLVEGRAAIEGRFSLVGSRLLGQGHATLPEARLAVPGRGSRPDIDLSGTRLDLQAARSGLEARLRVPLGDLGRVDGTLALPDWRPTAALRSDQPIAGRLQARLGGFEQLGDRFPQVSRVRGELDAEFGLAGTLGRPDLRGEARLRRAGLWVPLLGLEIAELSLDATATAVDRVRLSGGAAIGGGRLSLTGSLATGPTGPSARLQAIGEGLDVADTREYQVRISPRLDLEADASGARLRGEIRVPEARISPRSLPEGIVRPSRDVVVKGTERGPAYPLDLALAFRVGDAVEIDAFGLTGRLGGTLDVVKPPGRSLTGDGRLEIKDGRFRAPIGLGPAGSLAAPLTITRGELVWLQSPVTNPGLLFLARRGTGRAVANVRVVGTLADPRLTFFSDTDPTMTQAEATTFLLTGIKPRGDETGQSAAFAFGRQIAPGTFLEYEAGLGDAQNRIRLRRELTDRLQLEAQSGSDRSLDLFWSFERPGPGEAPGRSGRQGPGQAADRSKPPPRDSQRDAAEAPPSTRAR